MLRVFLASFVRPARTGALRLALSRVLVGLVLASLVATASVSVASAHHGECQSSILCERAVDRDFSSCGTDGCWPLFKREYVKYAIYACSTGVICYTEWRRFGCIPCSWSLNTQEGAPNTTVELRDPSQLVLAQTGRAQIDGSRINLLASPSYVSSPELGLCHQSFSLHKVT